MRPIAALLAIAAIAGGAGLLAAAPVYAQCSVFSRHPCVPNVCSVLSRHPCVPEPLYPFGENLQLTILSAASEHNPPTPGATIDSSPEGTNDTDRRLDTIRDLFGALRACWVPPPQDEARPGMQMSVRLSFKRGGQMIGAPRVTYTSPDAPPEARSVYQEAIMMALERCTPLRFTAGLGGAIAGRPIAIRYVDDRDSQ
jgi:hypothetical protein